MSKKTICDMCHGSLMPDFSDKGYKVTLKRLEHSYDGYNPWIRKVKFDLCGTCMATLAKVSEEIQMLNRNEW